MRTGFTGELDKDSVIEELKKILPENANIRFAAKDKKNILVLVTKEPHCLGDILVRHEFGELNAAIKGVVSNNPALEEFTYKFKIPFHHVSHENVSRFEHEHNMMKIIDAYSPDYLVLAKYMRVFTPDFVNRYRNRIINIHHSFLPAFMGASPYQQAFDRGVKIIGATAHFVTDDLDEGQIITQDIIHVDHTYGPEEMRQAGRDVEKIVLARALKLVFEDRVFISGNKTIVFE